MLSGYFSLLEKLISLSCLPQNLRQMKRKTIYLSDSNSQLNWTMKGGNETDLYPSLSVCRSFLEAPFVPWRCPSLHWFRLAITNKQHNPFTRSKNLEVIRLNLEEPVLFGLKTRGKACSSHGPWICQFVSIFLVKLGHGVPLLVITNLPLKFGLKRRNLKFWVFQALGSMLHLSPLDLGMDLEKNYHGFCKFVKFNLTPLEEMTKTRKLFWNWRSLVFQPILRRNTVFAKIEAKLAWHSSFKLW